MAGDRAPATSGGARFVRWRALVGAALVTAAAFGVVFAHRAAENPPETRYLVVTSPVAPGEVLRSEHLGSLAIELPDAVDAIDAQRSDEVLGRVASRALEPSELLTGAALVPRDRFVDPAEIEVAISVDPARTPVGQFRTGDRVTVLATGEDGTRELAVDARVTHLDDDERDSGIASPESLRLGLALVDIDAARSVVDAAINEELTIVLSAPGAGGSP